MTSMIKVDEIQNSAGTTTLAKFENGVLTGVLSPATGFRNRVINGDMRIDQRNAGASVTVNDTAPYVLDRYFAQDATDGAFTVQQSSVAPAGFTNSMLVTVTTADASLAAGQVARVAQRIEGFNVADLAWGTASALTVTLSFWVRSSLTGTFGGALSNAAFNRSYPFSYTINAANTFEYKTVTVSGDTAGTWLTNNGIGLELNFGLGVGSTFSGTAGAWSGAGLMSSTGATNLMATSGATFYLTGVSLEKGTVATPFEFRSIGQELGLCQRYFQKSYPQSAVPGSVVANDNALQFSFGTAGSGIIGTFVVYPVVMRASPTLAIFDIIGNSGRATGLDTGASVTNNLALNVSNATDTRLMVRLFGVSLAGMSFMYSLSAEL